MRGVASRHASCEHALHAVDKYLRGQAAWLVNYAKRFRAGLHVGTAVTEGMANFLVNRRMNNSQQMRWSRSGADLPLQVGCAIYNGTLGSGFGHRCESANTDPPLPKRHDHPISGSPFDVCILRLTGGKRRTSCARSRAERRR
jgi:hypothetical protein